MIECVFVDILIIDILTHMKIWKLWVVNIVLVPHLKKKNETYIFKYYTISFGKENDIYIKKEWRGMSYKYITYKLINNEWIEQRLHLK